ncbi:MAG TPA: chitinase [Ilumatobacteraceae bacterium]
MRSTRELEHRADDAVAEEPLPDEPRQRLSWARLGIVLLVAALIAGGLVLGIDKVSTVVQPRERSWSVPYVDVTLTPTYEFQNPESNPARDVALAFIVADPAEPCTPSWGGSYSMDQAKQSIELDRRISQLRAAGGDIMVSFGGQANNELAIMCTDQAKLTDAYRSVIDRYDVKVIDLDIEGTAVADAASIERRATALATIQKERAATEDGLAVWLTVPVSTGGLTADGEALVRETIKGGVALTGVNVMTMNFGSAEHPTKDMLGATKAALEASAQQLASIYAGQGVTLDEPQRWAHLGATPMIGQNDIEGEVFTIDDATGLADYANAKGLGRVSLWSLNRDTPCSASFADVMVLSNTCSSVEQDPLGFAAVFTALPGRAPYLPQTDSVTVQDRQQSADDPSKSPYPLWRPEAQYPEGYKVVRRGLVYQAKWYTQGQEPTTVVANPWDTPWSLVGPIGPDDKPYTPTTLAPGTYPDWNPDKLYAKGDKVLLEGLPYEARWPNQAEVPQTLMPVAPDSAWNPLFTIPGEPPST